MEILRNTQIQALEKHPRVCSIKFPKDKVLITQLCNNDK